MSGNQKKYKHFLIFTLKVVISSGALYLVFLNIALREVTNLLLNSKIIWILPSILIFIASKWISSIRLNFFFRSAGLSLPMRFNHKLYLLGMYYNLFLPGGIGGDGYKVYLLHRMYKTPVKILFKAVLLDRITGVLALWCIAVVLSGILELTILIKWLIYLSFPLSITAVWLFIKIWFREFLKPFRITTLQSFGVQILQLFSVLCLLFALDMYSDIGAYLLIFLISSMVAVIPFTIGGVGARELTFLLGAEWLGLDTGISVALSLMFYLITAMVSFLGIWYSLFPGELSTRVDVTLSDVRSLPVGLD